METYLLDWANLLLRWLHVIVAIAWIGSSFYFVFLDSSLTPPEDEQLRNDGVSGELWALHGGGFYHPVKFKGAPPKLPEHLHWFYWESYATWLSGFALFLVSYLWSPSVYLIDPNVMQWSPAGAIAAALAFLVVFWLLYDAICRTLGQSENGDAKVGALVLLLVCVASYAATHMFAGRAAFLLVGAMLATAMSANVFFWIIPGQRTMVADIQAGRPVDPIHGFRGKQRSVHNTYFTLPVLFAMLSNHYGWAYSHAHNWLVLVLIMLAGALIRQFFVARHKTEVAGTRAPWGWAAAGVAVLLGVAIWLAPKPAPVSAGAAAPVAETAASLRPQVEAVIAQRCALCHNANLANKGVALHTPELVTQHAQAIYQQVVVLKAMPMNNATQITDDDRLLVKRWFEAGAPGP
jgi:uncharacterized membrane protein